MCIRDSHMADHLEIDNRNIKIRTVLTRGEKCVTIQSRKDCQKRIEISLTPVSYTHLDVYKRQV